MNKTPSLIRKKRLPLRQRYICRSINNTRGTFRRVRDFRRDTVHFLVKIKLNQGQNNLLSCIQYKEKFKKQTRMVSVVKSNLLPPVTPGELCHTEFAHSQDAPSCNLMQRCKVVNAACCIQLTHHVTCKGLRCHRKLQKKKIKIKICRSKAASVFLSETQWLFSSGCAEQELPLSRHNFALIGFQLHSHDIWHILF